MDFRVSRGLQQILANSSAWKLSSRIVQEGDEMFQGSKYGNVRDNYKRNGDLNFNFVLRLCTLRTKVAIADNPQSLR